MWKKFKFVGLFILSLIFGFFFLGSNEMIIEIFVGKFKVIDNLWCVNSENDVIFVWNIKNEF